MYPTNRTAWNQVDPNLNAVNKANRQEDMSKVFAELEKSAAKNKGKSSQSSSQNFPPMPPLNLSVLKASQIVITPPLVKPLINPLTQPVVRQTVNQTQTNTTTATSTTTSSTSSTNSTRSRSSKKHRRAASDKTQPRAQDDASKKAADSSARQRTQSVRGMKYVTNSTKIKSPEAQKNDQMSSSSQSSSTATTPRKGESSGANTPPFSPPGKRLSNLRKQISENFSKVDFSKIPTSIKAALSPNASPRKSPREKQKGDPLVSVSFDERNKNAKKILSMQMTEEFQRQTLLQQISQMHAAVSENLPKDSPLANIEGIKLLIDDAKLRCNNSRVDAIVDWIDPEFIKFVEGAADGAFIKPWNHDSSDVDDKLKGYLESVKKTFARDFKQSNYQVRETDGSQRKLNTIDEFISYVDGKDDPGFAMVVSNFASQNLGNFLKNSLFLRQNQLGVSQSLLKLYDGTPILPQAIAKASYVLSKRENGSLIVDYTWEASKQINGGKEIRARELGGNGNTFAIEDPSLKITVKLEIKAIGECSIGNPHIRAEGWNQTPDR